MPLHHGPGHPSGSMTDFESFRKHPALPQPRYWQLVILVFNDILRLHVTVR